MFSGIKSYEVGKGNPPQTTKIRDDKPFTSEIQQNAKWLPFYDGKHIGRYEILWKSNNWIHYGKWLAAPRNAENFEDEKILIRKIIGKTLIANYVGKTSYCNTLLFVLKLKKEAQIDYKFVLGVLNSNFIGWYFRKKFQIAEDDTFPQIMIRDILQFAFPTKPIKKLHDSIVSLVKELLQLKLDISKGMNSKTVEKLETEFKYKDEKINSLVFELYGLTDSEIELIENNGF
jgi:adenine-specific DNA-methyltransferase